ncbi:UNVERIFIED_CONTAM: hypothetical protein RMT77_001839 [Armadillidium vulgare]
MGSKIDQIYRSVLLTKFFTHGWGNPESLRRIFAFRKTLSNREQCMKLVDKNHPITITKEVNHGDHIVLEAEFKSPLVDHLPGLLPKECERACFQMLVPKQWKSKLKPTCVHLAGTGDHGYWRRRLLMAKPLLNEAGIASIIHENPFYGLRKPQDQRRSSLRNVSDLFLMGGCLVLESIAIFHWAERQGLGPIGITGISMGGHMASLAACSFDKPIPLVPCLSWSTASGVFTQGVLSGAINWEQLKNQYFSDQVFRNELFNMIHSPEGHFRVFHEVGQKFAREFPESLKQVQVLQSKDSKKSEAKESLKSSSEYSVEYANQVSSSKPRSFINALNVLEKISFSKLKRKDNNSNLLLKFKKDKENISNPHNWHPVEIRPSTAKDKPPITFQPYVSVRDSLTWEALQFMRGIMDECTHLGNFDVPVDTSLIIIVAANDDGYMPRNGVIPLTDLWPNSELRTLNNGHITAFLFNQQVFRNAIKDAFDKTIKKYYSEKIPIHVVDKENLKQRIQIQS